MDPAAKISRRPGLGPGLGLAVVVLGTLLGPLDTAVNVAFPHITGAFGEPLGAIQWVVICYVLTYSSLILVCGRLGDLFGHRRIFALGLVVSAVALALCAVAPSFGLLLAFRVAQGVGTALMLSCSAALAMALYPEQRRPQVLGLYTMAFGLGAAVGPGLGGLMIEAWGWPSVFWFRVPLALAVLATIVILPAPARRPADGQFDLAGAILVTAALAGGVLALNRFGHGADGWPLGAALAALSLAAFVFFIRRQNRLSEPIIRPALFRRADFAVANLANTIVNFAGFAVLLFVPYYLDIVSGFPPALSGVVLALAPLGFILGSFAGGPLALRLAANRVCLAALALVAAGLHVVAGWPAEAGWWVLTPPLLLIGLGQGVFQVAYTETVVARLPAAERGVAGSLAMLTRTIGIVFGATILAAVFAAFQGGAEDRFLAAFGLTFETAALALVGFVLLTMLRPRVWFG